MTKKKKSILSDQRFIVLLVIIALSAVFSIMSKEFRQYTTLLSMFDFSYYDLLMAIGVTFPLITGGVDLSIGTGMVCYAFIAGTMVRSHGWPVAAAMVLCLVLGLIIGALNGVLIGIMNLPPFLATLCTCMITRGAGSLFAAQHRGRRLPRTVDGSIQSSRSQLVQEEVLPVTQSDSCG